MRTPSGRCVAQTVGPKAGVALGRFPQLRVQGLHEFTPRLSFWCDGRYVRSECPGCRNQSVRRRPGLKVSANSVALPLSPFFAAQQCKIFLKALPRRRWIGTRETSPSERKEVSCPLTTCRWLTKTRGSACGCASGDRTTDPRIARYISVELRVHGTLACLPGSLSSAACAFSKTPTRHALGDCRPTSYPSLDNLLYRMSTRSAFAHPFASS
jgi:hypothetical protein